MPVAFIHDLALSDLPADVVRQAKRCLLDLTGVAASGRRTELSRIAHLIALRQMGTSEGGARLIFDGRRASATGAAYAGASTIDAFDAHDGHRLTKGHAGVALLPVLLAVCDADARWDGREFLASLVMGYEIATRAGIALHATAADYHTSGAWNALAAAAITARHMRLSQEQTHHALGAAEYFAPRSQMMRCIDHPTMVKDGSGWGALTGVSAAHLAAEGFTGAPALLLSEPSGIWDDLGERWCILEQYFKPWPVCRWAQPAIEACLTLMARHDVDADAIETVEIATFAAAVRLGSEMPASTEAAQYALGFPVAAALVHGRLGAEEITGEGLADPRTAALLARIRLVDDPALTARFPAERHARSTMTLKTGEVLRTGNVAARGDTESPLSDAEIQEKFRALTKGLSPPRVQRIEDAIRTLDEAPQALAELADAVLSALDPG